jgi:uncharacterized protein (TIGR02246 family)
MMIRMLLVFLLLIGAGTAVGQQTLVPQTNDILADNQEDPELPTPKAIDQPIPEGSDEEAADEEAADEEAADEEAADEEAADEEAADEEMADQEAADQEAADEEAADEEAADQEAADQEAADQEAADEEMPVEQPSDEERLEDDPADPSIEQPMDEQDGEQAAILEVIDSFVLAFNRGDAKSLAAHWTEQGVFVTAEGERWQGPAQIETRYGEYFAQVEGARLELDDVHIEVQSPSVAVETGIARVIEPGRTPREFDYAVIHVRTSEGWKIDSVREVEVLQPPGREQWMQQLDWMVGQWVDQDGRSDIRTTCRWATNRSFLVQTFRVFVEGRVDFEGTQIIGWDPRAQTIRSWLFDSDGGFGVGRWSGSEASWTVHMLQILSDGRVGSSTSIYERIDDSTVTFRSVGRQVDGTILPNVDPVTFLRTTED